MSESTALALRESTEVEIRSEEVEGEVIGSRIDRPITFEPPYEVQLPDPDTDKWNNHGRLWLALEGVTEVLQSQNQPEAKETADRFALELLGRLTGFSGPRTKRRDMASVWANPIQDAIGDLASWRVLVDAIDGREHRAFPALAEILESLKIEIGDRISEAIAVGTMAGDGKGVGPGVVFGVASAGSKALKDQVGAQFGTQKREFEPLPVPVQERMRRILERLRTKGMRDAIEKIGKMIEAYEGPSDTWSDRAVDEFVDLERGSDLGRMAACEALRLAHPGLKKLWRAAYVERSLLQYRVGGRVPRRKRGPMVILIDESGSMCGEAEVQARSVAAAVLYHAARQRRAAWVIPFDSRVVRIDCLEKSGIGLEEAIEKLFGESSGGGTDFDGPLREAARLIREEPKADILMITDGEGYLSPEVFAELQRLKKEYRTRLFGYAIGGAAETEQMKQLADEWMSIDEAGVDSGMFE